MGTPPDRLIISGHTSKCEHKSASPHPPGPYVAILELRTLHTLWRTHVSRRSGLPLVPCWHDWAPCKGLFAVAWATEDLRLKRFTVRHARDGSALRSFELLHGLVQLRVREISWAHTGDHLLVTAMRQAGMRLLMNLMAQLSSRP